MINTNPEYAAAHKQLWIALTQLSAYNGNPSNPDPVLPEPGTDAYTIFMTYVTDLKKAVENADLITLTQRDGKFTNTEIGAKSNKNTNSGAIDKEVYDSARSYRNMFDRYRGFSPIFGRRYDIDRADTKINYRASNDFMGEIVDDKVAFTVGTPVSYKNLDKAQNQFLQDFLKVNNMAAFDADTMTLSTAAGVAYRYYWIEADSLKVTLLAPWDVIWLDFAPDKIAIHFIMEGGTRYAECFMGNQYIKISMGEELKYSFRYNLLGQPVVPYANNSMWSSDLLKVIELLDMYDSTLADCVNETAQLRTAYLNISGGLELEPEPAPHYNEDTSASFSPRSQLDAVRAFNENLKVSGVIQTPEGSSVGFITKTLQIQPIILLLDQIESNIYRFSKSVANTTKNSGDQPTAFSLSQRLRALRNKCLTSWLSFDEGNRVQWEVLSRFVRLRFDKDFDPLQVSAVPKLNVPIDLKEEIDNAIKLSAILPLKYALKQLSIFDSDEAVEEALVEIERAGITQLDDNTDAEDESKPVGGFTNEE